MKTDPPCLAIVLFTLQQIDQIHCGKEAHAFVVGRDSGYSQGTGQVCFPGSRAADKHDILRDFSEQGSLRLQIARSCDRVAAETSI
ncbi:Uncharacterized protein ALO63_03497 [Pseudomonas amygdali pv. mori]|uniref:Uncharacterized protein n=1 Tax=Pseudomonas amygdali pv. mori TaxID=34065 RepID=A0A0P9UJZ9_PSEA0|nr:Uncharacterized protein ALO63_03497 [Pseudomonas amygdali pv. mori]